MKETFQVYCIVGGSMEEVVLFESVDNDKCVEVAEMYEKNPRKLSHLTRNYMQGWGSGIDGVFIKKKS